LEELTVVKVVGETLHKLQHCSAFDQRDLAFSLLENEVVRTVRLRKPVSANRHQFADDLVMLFDTLDSSVASPKFREGKIV